MFRAHGPAGFRDPKIRAHDFVYRAYDSSIMRDSSVRGIENGRCLCRRSPLLKPKYLTLSHVISLCLTKNWNRRVREVPP